MSTDTITLLSAINGTSKKLLVNTRLDRPTMFRVKQIEFSATVAEFKIYNLVSNLSNGGTMGIFKDTRASMSPVVNNEIKLTNFTNNTEYTFTFMNSAGEGVTVTGDLAIVLEFFYSDK